MSSVLRHTVQNASKQYVSNGAFDAAIYTWDKVNGLVLTGVSSSDAAARVVLTETGRRLFPNIHNGTTPVTTLMVGVGFICAQSGLVNIGFIDPASPLFVSYTTDSVAGLMTVLAADQSTDGVNTTQPIVTDSSLTVGGSALISTGITLTSGTLVLPTSNVSLGVTTATITGKYNLSTVAVGVSTSTTFVMNVSTPLSIISTSRCLANISAYSGNGIPILQIATCGTNRVSLVIANPAATGVSGPMIVDYMLLP